jgi:hypothetical protein
VTSQPEPSPGEGRSAVQILRPVRDLAAYALVATPAVLLLVAVIRLIPGGVGEQFASRTQDSFFNFVNVPVIAFPLGAVLLSVLIRPQHPKANLIVLVATVEYAAAAFFGVIFGILIGLVQIATFSVRTAFEELLVRLSWLAVFAVAAFAVYQLWRNLFHTPKPKAQPGMYGQPQHGQPQHGQPQHGQPQHGQPQHGQPQHGQPQYGQPGAYPGQPGYGQPGEPGGQPGQPGQPGAAGQWGQQPGYPQPGAQPGGYGQPAYGQPAAQPAWGEPPQSAPPAQPAWGAAPPSASPAQPAWGAPPQSAPPAPAAQPAWGEQPGGSPTWAQPASAQPTSGPPASAPPRYGTLPPGDFAEPTQAVPHYPTPPPTEADDRTQVVKDERPGFGPADGGSSRP